MFQLDLSDDLPNSVCVSCFKTIRISYHFLKQFYETQAKLLKFRTIQLSRNHKEPEEAIISEEDESVAIQDFLTVHDYSEQTTTDIDVEPTVIAEYENNEETTEDVHIYESNEEGEEDMDDFENGSEELDEYENQEEFENGVSCDSETNIKIELLDVNNEDYENIETIQFIKEENPDLAQLLNLGDTDIDETNIEVVVDNSSRTENVEKLLRYICPICNKKFSRCETFYAHVTSYNLSTIKCTRCKLQPELDIDEYFRHYMDYHKYHCEICGKMMSSNYGYHYHVKHHGNIRNFKCPIEGCKRSFLMNHLLKKHIKSHDLKNSYACQFCDATFNTNDSRRYHLKLHYGKKDHLCTVCGQSFYQAVHLRDHMYRHIGYKKFVCDICGKGFVTNSSLKKHILYCSKKHNIVRTDTNIVIMN